MTLTLVVITYALTMTYAIVIKDSTKMTFLKAILVAIYECLPYIKNHEN